MSFRKVKLQVFIVAEVEGEHVVGYEQPPMSVVQASYDASSASLESPGPCDGCSNPGLPDHPCPYREDVNGDHESQCNCCADCQNACAMDI